MRNPPLSSRRVEAVQAPVIPRIAEWIRLHPGCISLGQGVAWYGPPAQARAALARFFDEPAHHRYGPVDGIPALRHAIAQKLRSENGWRGDDRGSRVVVTAGANMGFLNAILAIADPDDEVILPSPYYFNQEMAIRMANCRPVLVPTDTDYQLRLDRLEAAIGRRTRAIVTISPNNPTGAVYPAEALREVNALCRERGIYHICDEAYENFVFDAAEHFSPASIAGADAHTISLFSLSKAYGFASWRIGYMLIPAHLSAAVAKIQDTNLICAPLISQHAALGALEAGSAYCRDQLAVTRRVRERVFEELEVLRDFCAIPRTRGAFYVLVRVTTPLDSLTVAERLIREHGVAVIPGIAFGCEDGCYLRVAYGALDEGTAVEGLRRLTKGLRAVCRN
ncbi:MAG: pyridoxal phosphate-dependent aminotransferase [Gammaproteobacteria bacterium]|nr:pyridoxal phosphate-dependent aminotransferase [Gammaproteobacteria bacterium]